jgi:Type II secretion system (T2SS), protein E, N-terminal domain
MARLGELLVAAKLVSQAQIEQALRAQVLWGARLGTNLVELGCIDLDQLATVLAQQHRLPAALERHFEHADPALQRMLSPALAERHGCVPLVYARERIVIASISPLAPAALAEIASELEVAPAQLIASTAGELRIRYHLERVYQIARGARFLRSRGQHAPAVPSFEIDVMAFEDSQVDNPTGPDPDLATPRPPPRPPLPPPPPAKQLTVDELAAELRGDPPAARSPAPAPPPRPRPAPAPPPPPPAFDERSRVVGDGGPAGVAGGAGGNAPLGIDELTVEWDTGPAPTPKPAPAPDPEPAAASPLPELELRPPSPSAPSGRERRRYLPTLDAPISDAERDRRSLGRVAIRRLPLGEDDAGPPCATLADATRAIRRSTDRDRVAERASDALFRFQPGCSVALVLVIRGTTAIGWKGFSRVMATLPEIAVPVDRPGLIPHAVQSKQTARAVAGELGVIDRLLLDSLEVKTGDLVIVPVSISGVVMCVIALATDPDAPVTATEAIASAAGTAFGRLMRNASR